MALRFRGTHIIKTAQAVRSRLSQKSGNILVYIVMIMVIFAVLGVAMVSLFSTSISSSATANDTRRATYLSEAGIRYAASELRAAAFSKTTITALNNTVYTVSGAGRFDLNVFSPWFEPLALIDIGAGGNDTRVVELPEGELPPDFISAIPTSAPLLTIVNYDYIGSLSSLGSARGTITGAAQVVVGGVVDPKQLQLTISDDGNSGGFVAGKNETVCFAVKPQTDQINISLPASLNIEHAAAKIFPATGGAFEINRHNYYYTQAIDRTTYVELTGVTAFADEKSPWKDTISALTTDYVILSPRNRFAVSAGTSGNVTFGNSMDYAAGIADSARVGPSGKPDFEFAEEPTLSGVLSRNTSDAGFATLDDANRRVVFQKTDSGGNAQFATVWFKDNRAIGGQRDFCQNGRCIFGDGVRAFFLMTFTGSGDGFTFSLLSAGPNPSNAGAPNNTDASVGGDFQLGELLGYAGDGRLDTNPARYIDGTQHGLQAPKMAVEFDGYYNNSQAGYCWDDVSLRAGSRFDPDFPPGSGSGKDAVQYVFWASRNPVAVPCRNNELYDDNRHNPQDSTELRWTYSPVGPLEGTQSIKTGPDGTIYVVFGDTASSSASRLIAVDPFTGSLKWQFPAPTYGGTDYNLNGIAVDDAGNVYVGSDASRVFARDRNNNPVWANPFIAGGQVESPIAVSESPSRIYFGANAASNSVLFSVNKGTGIQIWTFEKAELGEISGGVTLDKVADPVDGKGTIYFGTDINPFLYAVRADIPGSAGGTSRWRYPSSTQLTGDILTQPVVNPSNRDVIFATTDGYVYALPYSTSSTPTRRWRFNTGSSLEAALAISPDGNTVYVGTTTGTNGGVLYALDAKTTNTSGSVRWRYPSSGSIGAIYRKPAVDGDGTIYFGSGNGRVYALNPDAGPLTDAQRLKWVYPSSGSIGAVESEIEIGKDGNILFISNDGRLYSVTPATVPPNLRNLYLTDTEVQAPGVSGPDWFGQGTWAVRVEVDRKQTPNANGKYEYTLRTWMRPCTDASACSDIVGKLYGNTRLRYDYKPSALTALPMTQTIELAGSDHDLYSRLLFGFTSATGAATQEINISQFQLSFIRPNDPVVTADPSWP